MLGVPGSPLRPGSQELPPSLFHTPLCAPGNGEWEGSEVRGSSKGETESGSQERRGEGRGERRGGEGTAGRKEEWKVEAGGGKEREGGGWEGRRGKEEGPIWTVGPRMN